MRAFILLLFFLTTLNSASAQNAVVIPIDVMKIVESIYSFKLKTADSLIKIRNAKYPDDSWTILSNINYQWWHVLSGNSTGKSMNKVVEYLDLLIAKNDDPLHVKTDQGLYFLTNAYAFKCRLSLLKGNKLEALAKLLTLMKTLKKTLGYESKSEYFLITSGLYYYFIDYCDKNYPISRPYINSLPKGSTVKGIATLKKGSESSLEIVSNECIYFLSKIYQEAEKDYNTGLAYARKLTIKYPHNLLYLYNLFEMELFSGKKEDAYKTLALMNIEYNSNHQLNTKQIDFFNKQTRHVLAQNLLKTKKTKK